MTTRTIKEALVASISTRNRVFLKKTVPHKLWDGNGVEITRKNRIRDGVRFTFENGEQYAVVVNKTKK